MPDEVVKDLCVKTPADVRPVTFITSDRLATDEQSLVLQLWLDALDRSGRDGVNLTLDEWDRVVLPARPPKLTGRFRAAGTDLILGCQLGIPVLIYLLRGHFGDRDWCPWIATPPQPAWTVPDHLRRLPADVLAFHTHLHDGLDSPLSGGMLPLAQLELVSHYHDPDWPFEMYPSNFWSELRSDGPMIAAPAEDPDWSQVVIVHNNRGSARICALLSADPDTIEGWYWVEGSMSPEHNIWKALDIALAHGASDWHYGDEYT